MKLLPPSKCCIGKYWIDPCSLSHLAMVTIEKMAIFTIIFYWDKSNLSWSSSNVLVSDFHIIPYNLFYFHYEASSFKKDVFIID